MRALATNPMATPPHSDCKVANAMNAHAVVDERSLAFDQAIAAKVIRDPQLVSIAQANVERWLRDCSPSLQPTFQRWQTLLSGPRDTLLATLVGTDEESTRLRQSSPFCGILTEDERTAIIRRFHDREPTAA
jgi:hypothetical protein